VNVLLIGNGIHASKRILPALQKIKNINSISIFDRNEKEKVNLNEIVEILPYKQLHDINHNYDLAIIATPPYNHIPSYELIKNNCTKILIEKPLTHKYDQISCESIQEDIKKSKLIECLMYFHHPVWKEVKRLITTKNIININTEFSVPHLPENSYRYASSKGGGSLLDQGVYPLSLISTIINNSYKILDIEISRENGYEVDLSGKLSLKIDNKIDIEARWALGMEYKNYLMLKDDEGYVYEVNFFYSKPDLTNTEIAVSRDKSFHNIEVGVYDQFEIMYTDALSKDLSEFEYSNLKNLSLRYSLVKEIIENI
jgi:predicted dehydrogenase